jgi:hypothetical protein
MYALEGIAVVLPIENSMRTPEDAPSSEAPLIPSILIWNAHTYLSVIIASSLCYTATLGIFGSFGYIYGFGTCSTLQGTVVTDCMPVGLLTDTVKVAGVAYFHTYLNLPGLASFRLLCPLRWYSLTQYSSSLPQSTW